MKSIENNIKNNLLIYIFFTIYLIIGLIIYRDFGISFDENLHRINGFIALKYISNLLTLKSTINYS